MKDMRRKYNSLIDLTKFTSNKKILSKLNNSKNSFCHPCRIVKMGAFVGFARPHHGGKDIGFLLGSLVRESISYKKPFRCTVLRLFAIYMCVCVCFYFAFIYVSMNL